MPTKLYVGNLAYAVTQEDLAELFAQAGKVESAVVVSDKFSGQSRGFGFVEMAEAADAATAISTLNDTDLKGRRIKIDEARASTGGPRGGGGGGRRRRSSSRRRRWRRRSRGRWRRRQSQPLVTLRDSIESNRIAARPERKLGLRRFVFPPRAPTADGRVMSPV